MSKYFLWAGICSFFLISSCADLMTSEQLSNGAKLFEGNCANCHQKDGSGLADLIPPLANSDFLKENKKNLVCYIQFGIKGKIYVNGRNYTLAMPANTKLNYREIADISSYVFQKFLNEPRSFSDSLVNAMLDNCK